MSLASSRSFSFVHNQSYFSMIWFNRKSVSGPSSDGRSAKTLRGEILRSGGAVRFAPTRMASINLERTLPRWVRGFSWSALVSQASKQEAHINCTHDADNRVVVRLGSVLDRLIGRESFKCFGPFRNLLWRN